MNLDDFYPLETFLTMEHPSLKSALALKDKFGSKENSGGSQAIILTGEQAEEFLKASGAADPANFYTQARGFADYVIGVTGDEQIFAKLAHHLGAGHSFESWLMETEKLPNDLQKLKKQWENHLSTR